MHITYYDIIWQKVKIRSKISSGGLGWPRPYFLLVNRFLSLNIIRTGRDRSALPLTYGTRKRQLLVIAKISCKRWNIIVSLHDSPLSTSAFIINCNYSLRLNSTANPLVSSSQHVFPHFKNICQVFSIVWLPRFYLLTLRFNVRFSAFFRGIAQPTHQVSSLGLSISSVFVST